MTRTIGLSEDTLAGHLTWWGLRRFRSDAAYYRWQEESLSPEAIRELNRRAQAKSAFPESPSAETAFYDLAARPDILPVLYSQRYEYYLHVGREVVKRLGRARVVLDVGCGVGVLTTWYARQSRDVQFIGIDRSPASVSAAREHAELLGLRNVRFVCEDIEQITWQDPVDFIVSTHAMVQSERDPGVPSRSWQTFARDDPHPMQRGFEERTGVGKRVDRCGDFLTQEGRMICVEKTSHLARRIPFQRALASRGFRLLEPPVPITYGTLDEVTLDGPLFVVGREDGRRGIPWTETPVLGTEETLYWCVDGAARANWKRLPGIHKCGGLETNGDESRRVEWGLAGDAFAYGYVASAGFTGLVLGRHDALEPLANRLTGLVPAVREDVARWESLIRTMWPTEKAQVDPHEAPLYESHAMAAQLVWEALPARRIKASSTSREQDGREFHVELGTTGEMAYLYWANTFDQRQLVIVDLPRAASLDAYYREATAELSAAQG